MRIDKIGKKQHPLPDVSLLAEHRQLLVAFSGGLDSTVLLYWLSELAQQTPLTLRAIHVHHGLSPNADQWLRHCQQICAQLTIPLITRKVDLNQSQASIEAQARQARYRVFAQVLRSEEVLVTAHHQDDQCETLLLALKRGSGPAGLAAMPSKLAFKHSWLLRPLLSMTRHDLLQFARDKQLHWIEDESNTDTRYDRNFLRQDVLPILTERWPHFVACAARSAALCGEQEHLLDELLNDQLQVLLDQQKSLDIVPLMTMSELKRHALLRRWLAHCQAAMPSRDALKRIWQEVSLAREDASPALQLGSGIVRRYKQRLYWGRHYQGQRDTQLAWHHWQQPLTLPDHLGQVCLQPHSSENPSLPAIRWPQRGQVVTIRFYCSGKLSIDGRSGRRNLKKIWQEQHIAPWLRDNIPLLFYDNTLICAAGVFVTQQGVSPEQSGASLLWLQTSDPNAEVRCCSQ